jgi:Superinfection immunity protein
MHTIFNALDRHFLFVRRKVSLSLNEAWHDPVEQSVFPWRTFPWAWYPRIRGQHTDECWRHLARLVHRFHDHVLFTRNGRHAPSSSQSDRVLNIFLGWSGVGWVIALAWSFTADVETQRS